MNAKIGFARIDWAPDPGPKFVHALIESAQIDIDTKAGCLTLWEITEAEREFSSGDHPEEAKRQARKFRQWAENYWLDVRRLDELDCLTCELSI